MKERNDIMEDGRERGEDKKKGEYVKEDGREQMKE